MKLKLFCCILAMSFLSFSTPVVDQASAAQENATIKSYFDTAKGSGGAKSGESPKTADKPITEAPAPTTNADTGASGDGPIQRAQESLALLAPVAKVAAGNITTDANTRSVAYENVSITMPDEAPDFEIRISKITVGGMDAASYDGNPGDMTSIEKVAFQEIKLLSGETQMAVLDEYLIEELSIPYRDTLNTLRESKGTSEWTESDAFKLAQQWNNFKINLIQANKFQMDVGIAQASLDRIESRDVSAMSAGQSFVQNIVVTFQGQQVFSLDKFGYAGVVMPEILNQISQMQNPSEIEQKMFSIMGDPLGSLNKLAIQELYLDNLQINAPGTIPVTLGKFTCDLLIKDNTASLTSKTQELSLPLSKLEDPSDFAILIEAAGNQDLLLDMNLSAKYDAQQKITVNSSFSEKKKGSISVDTAYAMVDGTSGAIHSAELKADNKGIIDLLLGAFALSEETEGSYNDFLQGVVAIIQSGKEALPEPGLADGVEKAAQLIEKGGTFRFALTPSSPINVDDIGSILGTNPSALGYVFEYAAPATPLTR